MPISEFEKNNNSVKKGPYLFDGNDLFQVRLKTTKNGSDQIIYEGGFDTCLEVIGFYTEVLGFPEHNS